MISAFRCKDVPFCKHQTCPITRLSRAASTTVLVTSSKVLMSSETVAVIIRVTGGNFRLLNSLLTQIQRILG
jgi:hypothetical protein